MVSEPFRQKDIRNLAVFRADVFSHYPQRASPFIEDQNYALDKMCSVGDCQEPGEGGGDGGVDVVNEAGNHPPEGDAVSGLDDENLTGAGGGHYFLKLSFRLPDDSGKGGYSTSRLNEILGNLIDRVGRTKNQYKTCGL